MEYTVSKLSEISGVSARTLRYYDEIGLLKPERISEGGYRIYSEKQVDLLQQILFYRALGVKLDEISDIIYSENFDRLAALEKHLTELSGQKRMLNALIRNVQKTIFTLKGEGKMTDEEKFEGLKNTLIETNEKKFGKEIREKYGDETVEASREKLLSMDKTQYESAQELKTRMEMLLKEAAEKGDPKSDEAMQVCELHKKWLCTFWKDGMYTKEAHRAMGNMYISDERFKEYYDNITPGAAQFLKEALDFYTAE